MRTRVFTLGLLCAASLCAQRRFSWQGYCFDHPSAPFCSGKDYAVKNPPRDGPPRDSVTDPLPPAVPNAASSLAGAGGIDWRFADPTPDALVGFNFRGLSASPLARSLILRLGAGQNLTEADMQKIFDGLSGIDQAVLSVRDNRILVVLTGRVADLTFAAPEPGWKSTPIAANALLVGHADAVDQALQRILMKATPPELARLAEEQQANSEFWAVGSAALLGPQVISEGVKRFALAVSIRNRLTSDLGLDLGGATPEGNTIHVRMSLEAGETQQKLGPIVESPAGQRLAALVQAARYLPVRITTAPDQAKPLIYGLDSGPKEVKQYPKR